MGRFLAKPKRLLFWGFILAMIFGPAIGWPALEHGIGSVVGHGWHLIVTVWDATVGHVAGHHGVTVH